MPVDLGSFDASLKKGTGKLGKVCTELRLDEMQCKLLESKLGEICGKRIRGTRKPRGERPLSRWQECIKKERAGKPFDPQAIKELAKLYRQGKCP